MRSHTNYHKHRDGTARAATAVLFAVAGLMISPVVGQDEKSSAAGEWTWEYESFGGRQAKDSVTLAVEETKVTGEHTGFFGPTKIEDGKIDGSAISFLVSRTFGDRTIKSKYSGKVDGDKITGSIETEGFNDAQTIDWKAFRKPEIDPSGQWVWTSTGRGGERKSWVKLKYDKGALTGLYLTERSQAPIQKATLKGKTVRFEIARRGRGGSGNARITTYDGNLSEKGITGSITTKLQDEDRIADWEAARDTPKVDPVGAWAWKQRGRDGDDVESEIVVKKGEGDSLSGTYTRNENSSDLEDVKLDGDTLSFKVTRETGQGTFSSKYSAKIDEDAIAGTISGTRGERTWSFPFAATRKLPKPEPVGSWSWTTRRFSRDGGGEERKNTLALKSEDGKITGTYSAGDQSSDIKEAKLDGNTVSFDIERTFGDRSVKVRYSGLIRGDAIKRNFAIRPC